MQNCSRQPWSRGRACPAVLLSPWRGALGEPLPLSAEARAERAGWGGRGKGVCLSPPRLGHGAARLLGLCRCPRPESSHRRSPQTNPSEDPSPPWPGNRRWRRWTPCGVPPRPPVPAERGSPGSESSHRLRGLQDGAKPVPSPPFAGAPRTPAPPPHVQFCATQ